MKFYLTNLRHVYLRTSFYSSVSSYYLCTQLNIKYMASLSVDVDVSYLELLSLHSTKFRIVCSEHFKSLSSYSLAVC